MEWGDGGTGDNVLGAETAGYLAGVKVRCYVEARSGNAAFADEAGRFDAWIELHNLSDADVDLTGMYLSDNANNPRKWALSDGTAIAANGYLIVWADEYGDAATEGLHANFKLSAGGEEILLVDTDENLNALLDSVEFSEQPTDISHGRTSSDDSIFDFMTPTPGAAND